MNRYRRHVLGFAILLGLAAGAALLPRPGAARPAARTVTLLSTADFHGALVHGGRERGTDRPFGGAVALEQLVRRERAAYPKSLFQLDSGDEMQGTAESNFTYGRSSIAVLNALGTDAAALGNHEFDWGIDTLRARIAAMHYPMLAANVFEKRTGQRPAWIRPWVILKRDGVKVGVIGFVTPDTPRVTLPDNVASLRFDEPAPLLPELVRTVRRNGANLVIVVCHIGGEQAKDGTITGPVAELAHAGRGLVDAVLGGHTHTFVAGSVDSIPVVVAGASGRVLGRIQLDWDGKHARATDVRLFRAYSDSLQVPPQDPIAALVDSMREIVRPFVSRVLGQSVRHLRQASLANLVTDAMRSAVRADVAITNPGGLRRDIEEGPITMGDVFELMPFENVLATVQLTGVELRAVIASRPEKVLLSGMHGRYDPNAPADSQLVLQLDGGRPLAADSTYLVVTNNFLVQGGDGFVGFDAGRNLALHSQLVRDAIVQAIEAETRAGRAIDPDPQPRLERPESSRP